MADSVAQDAINLLQKEQEQYFSAAENKDSVINQVEIPEAVVSTNVTEDEFGKWKSQEVKSDPPISRVDPEQEVFDEIKQKPEILRNFCKTVDDKIIAFNAQINSLKQQIVTLSVEATAGNCWPGIAYSSITSNGSAQSTPQVLQSYITNTAFNQDRDLVSIYTNFQGPTPNYDASNPFDPDSSVGLTDAYSGYGRLNTKDDNGGSSIGNARLDISSTQSDHNARSVEAFRWYPGAGVAPLASNTSVTPSRCVEISNAIASLQSQITSIRAQRDSLRSNLNIIKAEKGDKDLQAWGIINTERKIAAQKTSKSTVITAIQNLS